jgi:hypothetical protein
MGTLSDRHMLAKPSPYPIWNGCCASVSIPLQTYPDAIKAVAPLIDRGKIDDAKAAIEAALNTLVVIDHITPLPLVRADVKVVEAEALAQKEGRSEEDNKNPVKSLNEAREQLKLAEALGYGNKKDPRSSTPRLTSLRENGRRQIRQRIVRQGERTSGRLQAIHIRLTQTQCTEEASQSEGGDFSRAYDPG